MSNEISDDRTAEAVTAETATAETATAEAGDAPVRKARKEPVFGLKLIRRRVSRIQGMQQRRKAVRSRDALLREVLTRIADGSANNPKAWAAAVLAVYDPPATGAEAAAETAAEAELA